LKAEMKFAPAPFFLPLCLWMSYFLASIAKLLSLTTTRTGQHICKCGLLPFLWCWEAEMVPQLAKEYTRSQLTPSKPWRHAHKWTNWNSTQDLISICVWVKLLIAL